MPDEIKPAPPADAWQLVQHLHFPTAVYTALRPDFLAPVRAVFDDYMAQARLKRTIDPLHPQLMSDSFLQETRIAPFAHHLATAAWQILKDQGYRMDGHATFFSDMWGQQHGKSSSVAEHIHPGDQIVGFYFLSVPPGSSTIQLHDPRPGKAMADMPGTFPAPASMASAVVSIAPEPGMLFFASGWLPHSFTRHGADAPLEVVHFNLGVRKVAPAPVQAGRAAIVI